MLCQNYDLQLPCPKCQNFQRLPKTIVSRGSGCEERLSSSAFKSLQSSTWWYEFFFGSGLPNFKPRLCMYDVMVEVVRVTGICCTIPCVLSLATTPFVVL